jgi:glycosyltransferase
LKIKCWLKASKKLRTLIYRKRRNSESNYKKTVVNPILHGSFIVYSKDYIKNEKFAFNPNTFFYFETEILDYECEKKGYKRLYTPEIKVLHHQNVATNQVYSNLVEKTIFSNKCNFESSSYFLELMGKER